ARKFVATVSHDEPDSEELSYLSEQSKGRLVVVDVREGVDVGSVLSAAAARGVQFQIVFGGVSVLQRQSFGSLTVDLTGERHEVDRTIDELSQLTTVKEVSA
ncbi:NIL domain-containing protein, partial [Kocuria subflava]